MAQEVKLSILESSKCVYGKNIGGNPRKNLHVFSRFKTRVLLSLHTTKLLYNVKKQNIKFLFKRNTFFFANCCYRFLYNISCIFVVLLDLVKYFEEYQNSFFYQSSCEHFFNVLIMHSIVYILEYRILKITA